MSAEKIKFLLNGCDIYFYAEAPADITLAQLLKLADKINPDYCACGICTYSKAHASEKQPPEIIFGYDSVKKANDNVACWISGEESDMSE